jgi:hypothetical protein
MEGAARLYGSTSPIFMASSLSPRQNFNYSPEHHEAPATTHVYMERPAFQALSTGYFLTISKRTFVGVELRCTASTANAEIANEHG